MPRIIEVEVELTVVTNEAQQTRHSDHSGNNTEFPDTIDFVAHENTAGHMSSRDCDDGAGFEGGSTRASLQRHWS